MEKAESGPSLFMRKVSSALPVIRQVTKEEYGSQSAASDEDEMRRKIIGDELLEELARLL